MADHPVTNIGKASLEPKEGAIATSSFESVEQTLFKSLDTDGQGLVSKSYMLSKFEGMGILRDDPRLQEGFSLLDQNPNPHMDLEEFSEFSRTRPRLVRKTLEGGMAIPDFQDFCNKITEIYNLLKNEKGGKVADYIPQLARVNPDQFGVSICTVDGQRFSIGDSETFFCSQSSCKPVNYCLALEDREEDKVHQHVGHEPSGRGFNELTLNTAGLPHNPMINAGAIMCCSLLKPELPLADRFEYVMDMFAKLAGHQQPRFNNSVYLSEKATADRNFALGYFMREKQAFPEGADLTEVLEFYFQCCSIEVTSSMMATVGATLASAGICPTTDEKILKPEVVKNCLSLMSSCGMYDFSGEFAFKIGLPAKSGVSGVVMVVIPNLMGICIWSPRLDPIGNSVRGTKFCQELVKHFNFHTFDSLIHNTDKVDPRMRKFKQMGANVSDLLWAASQGDLNGIQQMLAEGLSINVANYDGRTPLHLAASEGHHHLIEYFASQDLEVNAVDRWGQTGLDDAMRHHHKHVVELLLSLGAKSGADLSQSMTYQGQREYGVPVY